MEGILRLKFWLAAALVALFGFGLLVVSVVQAAQNRSAKAGIARDLEKVSTSMKNPIHNSKWANQLREHEASYREQLKAVTADLQKQGKLLKRPFADPRPDAFGFLEIYPGKVKELKERLADSVYESDPRALRDRGQEFFRSQEYPEDSEMRKAEQEYWIQEAIVSAVERTNDGPEDKILGFRRLTLKLNGQPDHYMRAAHKKKSFGCHVFGIVVVMVYEDVPVFLKELLDVGLALEITSVSMDLGGARTLRSAPSGGGSMPAGGSGPGERGFEPPEGFRGGGPDFMFDGVGGMDEGFAEPPDERVDTGVPGSGKAGRDKLKREEKERRKAELSDRGPLLSVTIKGYVPEYTRPQKKVTGRSTPTRSRRREGARNAR